MPLDASQQLLKAFQCHNHTYEGLSCPQQSVEGGWTSYLGGRWGLGICFEAGFPGRHGQQIALMDDSHVRGKLLRSDCTLAEGMLLELPSCGCSLIRRWHSFARLESCRWAHLPYHGVCNIRGLQASIRAARGLFYLLHGAWPAEA